MSNRVVSTRMQRCGHLNCIMTELPQRNAYSASQLVLTMVAVHLDDVKRTTSNRVVTFSLTIGLDGFTAHLPDHQHPLPLSIANPFSVKTKSYTISTHPICALIQAPVTFGQRQEIEIPPACLSAAKEKDACKRLSRLATSSVPCTRAYPPKPEQG